MVATALVGTARLRLSGFDRAFCALLVLPILVLGLAWADAWAWAQAIARDFPLIVGVR